MEAPRLDFDILWKEMIELFIEEFVEFFMSDLYPQVDFSKKPDFLDKELDKIFGDGKPKGGKRCDKLVRLHLKNGKDCWILVHIEVQQQPDNNFCERMFVYYYRIFDKYADKTSGMEAIAVLLTEKTDKEYNHFKHRFGQTGITYYYRSYLLFFVYYAIALPEASENKFEYVIKQKFNMETPVYTFQEGAEYFFSRVFGYNFEREGYIQKHKHDKAIQEARMKEEQARVKEEQARVQEEQARMKEEQARMKEEQERKEKELLEQKLQKTIIKLYKNNTSIEDIAGLTDETTDKITAILKDNELV